MTPYIRPVAICVFSHRGRILVSECYDPVKDEIFYRPLGGSIEFGERSMDAVIRELREELGAEVTDLRWLGVIENLFTFNGKPGHEIVMVYDGKFTNASLYEQVFWREDDPAYGDCEPMWKPLAFFEQGNAPLYPEGLFTLLKQHLLG